MPLIAAGQPDGELLISEEEAMRPNNLESDAYNELWTYHITLNNGYQIIYAFTITDFGNVKDRATGLKYQTTWKEGKHYVVRKEYDPEDLVYDAEKNLLRLHAERPYWAKGSFNEKHILNMQTSKDGVDYYARLTITDTAPPMTWGDGIFTVDNKTIMLTFPIPYGHIQGDIAINGDTLKNISGTVYMDHLTQTDLGVNIFKAGYRVQKGNATNGMVGTFLKPHKADTLVGYGIAFNEGKPVLVKPQNDVIHEKQKIRGNKIAGDITFKFYEHPPLRVKIENTLHDYSILDEIGGFKKFFAKRVLGGEMVQFNGFATTTDNERVIFNYFIKD